MALFYTTNEFAAMMGRPETYVCNAAAAYVDPSKWEQRRQLPHGWVSFRFSRIYIIFRIEDREAVRRVFSLNERMERVLE